MKITFLNVGHGDSIILEWKVGNEIKVGILDCNRYNGSNPVVKYLQALNNLKAIEFIVLSHPHVDHYSGFLELFSFIEKNDFVIKHFIHSLYGDPKYLNFTEIDQKDRIKLKEVIDKILDFKDDKNIIQSIGYATLNWSLDLGAGYFLKAISPSDSEVRTAKDKIKYYKDENKFLCSRAANYLSTIFIVSNNSKNKHFLLTSDALDFSFERLIKTKIIDNILSGSQIPHHGSSNSLYKPFWEHLSLEENKKAFISAGLNEKYKLPDYEVVSFYHNQKFNIDITNQVNGYKDFFAGLQNNTYQINNALDDDSELITDSYLAKTEISTEI